MQSQSVDTSVSPVIGIILTNAFLLLSSCTNTTTTQFLTLPRLKELATTLPISKLTESLIEMELPLLKFADVPLASGHLSHNLKKSGFSVSSSIVCVLVSNRGNICACIGVVFKTQLTSTSKSVPSLATAVPLIFKKDGSFLWPLISSCEPLAVAPSI